MCKNISYFSKLENNVFLFYIENFTFSKKFLLPAKFINFNKNLTNFISYFYLKFIYIWKEKKVIKFLEKESEFYGLLSK